MPTSRWSVDDDSEGTNIGGQAASGGLRILERECFGDGSQAATAATKVLYSRTPCEAVGAANSRPRCVMVAAFDARMVFTVRGIRCGQLVFVPVGYTCLWVTLQSLSSEMTQRKTAGVVCDEG